jgi:hypothetical protein
MRPPKVLLAITIIFVLYLENVPVLIALAVGRDIAIDELASVTAEDVPAASLILLVTALLVA